MSQPERNESADVSGRRKALGRLAPILLAVVFVLQALLYFTRAFPNFIHSDAVVEVLLGVELLKKQTITHFYLVNGDIWLIGPHWLAAALIPIFGVSPACFLTINVLTLCLELAALTWAFRRLCGSRWRATCASLVVLFPWSSIYLHFQYVEVTYGYLATIYFLVMALYAEVFAPADPTKDRGSLRDEALASIAFFVVAVQNPTRAVASALVPLVVTGLWMSRLRGTARLRPIAPLVATWGLALAVHRSVLAKSFLFAPNVELTFKVQDWKGIVGNLRIIASGAMALVHPRNDIAITAAIGAIVFAGVLFWTVRTVWRREAPQALRVVGVALLVELVIVVFLLAVGNLVIDDKSMRYVMPSLLPMAGVAYIGATGSAQPRRWQALALGWLCVLPFAAGLATSRRITGPREVFADADPAVERELASALSRRNLAHGFATYWNANVVTVLSKGAARTCPVWLGDGVVPQRWLVDRSCFERSNLPTTFYVVVQRGEEAAAARAISKSLPPPIERFRVHDDFEVSVFRTEDGSLSWLDL